MSVEFKAFLPHSSSSIRSELISLGRLIVPQKYRATVRDIFLGPPDLPFSDPFVLKGEVEARFFIKNRSDFVRIVENSVEENYRAEMENVFAVKRSTGSFLDIGCAQGLYSILAAKYGLVVNAVDPDPVSLASLRANISLNSLSNNIAVFPIALSDLQGETDFYIDKSGSFAPSMIRTVAGLKELIRVPVDTVDNLIEDEKIYPPTIVKLDVEGAEGKVLEGMKKLFSSKDKPNDIFIELHKDYLQTFGDNINEVGARIINCGYRVRWSTKCPWGFLCHFVAN